MRVLEVTRCATFGIGLIVLAGPMARGQGLIFFNNSVPGVVDARIYDETGTNRLSGSLYRAQLFVGPTAAELFPVGTPQAFRTGAGAGYVVPTTVTVPGVAPGAELFVQVRSWDTRDGATYDAAAAARGRFGTSKILKIRPTGPFASPALHSGPAGADLVGLNGFGLGQGLILSQGLPATGQVVVEGSIGTTSCGTNVSGKQSVRFRVVHAGRLTVSTVSSPVDAVLEGYSPYYIEGDSASLQDCGDAPADDLNAAIAFNVQAGVDCWITVAGKTVASGVVTLAYRLEKLPVNSLVIAGPLDVTYDGSAKSLSATSDPEVAAIHLTYNASTDPPIDANDYTVIATVEDPTYGGSTTNILHIRRAPQTITSLHVPAILFPGQSDALTATASSRLPVTFGLQPGSPGTLAGNQLTATASGTIQVEIRQEGNTNYLPATLVVQIAVADAQPRISLARGVGGILVVTVSGTPGQRYAIQSTSSLPAADWTDLVVGTADNTGSRQWGIAADGPDTRRYLRARLVPP